MASSLKSAKNVNSFQCTWLRHWFFCFTSLTLYIIGLSQTFAAPEGWTILSGEATITQIGNTTTVTQTSPTLIIAWNSFNVSPNEVVNFVQPSTSSSVTNQILNDQVTISGAIQVVGNIALNTTGSTGNITVLNPNGGVINAGGTITLNTTGGGASNTGGGVSNTGGGVSVGSGNQVSIGAGGAQTIALSNLQAQAISLSAIDNNLNMMMHGAHSRPLSHLVAPGEKTVWVAGDIGRDDHGRRDGDTGLAEINIGHHFGMAQVNLTLGQTWANQQTALGGQLHADGQYLMAEMIVPMAVEQKIYGVLGGFTHWGETDIRRGYIAGGNIASSKGDTDSKTYGVRARLEWLDGLDLNNLLISPYADVSYVHTELDGYTEQSGPVILAFNRLRNDNTTLRIGLNARHPIAGTHLQWVANIESAHATSKDGGAISGAIAGTAVSFSTNAVNVQNNWLKAGIGAEGAIGSGRATLMLNGTTTSGLPSVWLAASYQWFF